MENIDDNYFEERERAEEEANAKFIEKADVGKTMGLMILDRWEDLIGEVYHKLYTDFPEQMTVDIINLLLEREREIPE